MGKEGLYRQSQELGTQKDKTPELTLGSLVIKSPNEEKIATVTNALSGIPLEDSPNITGLSYLIGQNETAESLREKLIKGYQNEVSYQKSIGENSVFLNNEQLFHILKPNYRLVLEKLTVQERWPRAVHEIGHEVTAKMIGGQVSLVSVIPAGDGSLGRTFVYGNFSIVQSIAVAYGGYVAESVMGIRDHRGTGGDMSRVDYLINVYDLPHSAVSQAESMAALAVRGFGRERIAERAKKLATDGVLI